MRGDKQLFCMVDPHFGDELNRCHVICLFKQFVELCVFESGDCTKLLVVKIGCFIVTKNIIVSFFHILFLHTGYVFCVLVLNCVDDIIEDHHGFTVIPILFPLPSVVQIQKFISQNFHIIKCDRVFWHWCCGIKINVDADSRTNVRAATD